MCVCVCVWVRACVRVGAFVCVGAFVRLCAPLCAFVCLCVCLHGGVTVITCGVVSFRLVLFDIGPSDSISLVSSQPWKMAPGLYFG